MKIHYDKTTKEVIAITSAPRPNSAFVEIDDESTEANAILQGAIPTVSADNTVATKPAVSGEVDAINIALASASTFAEQQELLALRELKERGIVPASGAPVVNQA